MDEIELSSCVAFKSEIIDQPNFDVFDKIQEILNNVRKFIFGVTENLETKIDEVESLYLSR